MKRVYRIRRTIGLIIALAVVVGGIFLHPSFYDAAQQPGASQAATGEAATALEELPVKGRAPKTDYSRDQFGGGWAEDNGCDTRNTILYRDLKNVTVDSECRVISGMLNDPYTGKTIQFTRGETTSDDVQIDHVVALSNAWQTGAQQLDPLTREELANDPLELLAVDGAANQQKSDGDAATWLPSNKAFRCQYVARQIAVKKKYSLWVTQAEKEAIKRVLAGCPGQHLP
ncbi:MAG TPA: HNH endonuclease family protein [Candidatus Saccharimonadales bacterium]